MELNEVRIKEEIKKKTREERIKLLKEEPLKLRKMVIKAWNYIEKHNKANDGYPLPENIELDDLLVAINQISDEDLLSAFDGKRIEADKLYELCMKALEEKKAEFEGNV